MNDARREWRERIVNDFRAGRLLLTSVSLNNLLCDAMAVADANPLEQGGVREALDDVKQFCAAIREDFDHALGVSAAGARKIDRVIAYLDEKIAHAPTAPNDTKENP